MNLKHSKDAKPLIKNPYPKDRPRDFKSVHEWLMKQPEVIALLNALAEYDKT